MCTVGTVGRRASGNLLLKPNAKQPMLRITSQSPQKSTLTTFYRNRKVTFTHMNQHLIQSMQQNAPARPASLRRTALKIFLFLLGLYALSAGYAIITQRYLYGDASWFLVKILSTGTVTSFYTDFWHQFYYSRFVSYWLTQAPTVLALHMGIHSPKSLSWILGSTYFGTKFVSLVLCYKLLDENKKIFMLFPLFGLFAGTINSDIYIVTETHVAVSFLWPIAILLNKKDKIGTLTKYLGCTGILAASFTYESWVFFSPLLIIAGYLNARSLNGKQQTAIRTLSAFLLVPACISLAAILFPRDPTNEGGFVHGVLAVFADIFKGIPVWHTGALVSVLAILLLGLSLLCKREVFCISRYRWILWPLLLFVAVAPPLHFLMFHNGLVFGYSIMDRGFAGLASQLALLALYICVSYTRMLNLLPTVKTSTSILIALAIGQVGNQLLATRAWALAMDATKATLATEYGAVPCNMINRYASSNDYVAPSLIVCGWWAYPISILFSKAGMVQSFLIPSNLGFQPFNPFVATGLPTFRFGGPDYSKYKKTLGSSFSLQLGEHALFTLGSSNTVMLKSGFSYPENWATWTDSSVADMHVCLKDLAKTRALRLTFDIVPFVTASQPYLPVSVTLPSGRNTQWNFPYGDPKPVRKFLIISADNWPKSGCGDITFHMPSSLRSPLELGISKDPRKLGFALIGVTITR